jgi:hypothetical protein
VNAGIAWDWTAAQTTGSSYQCVFERIAINTLNFKYAIAAGENSGASDVSAGVYRDISIDGAWTLGSADTTRNQAGILVGSGTGGNILNHHIDGCRIHYVRRAVHVNNVNQVEVKAEASHVDEFVYKVGAGVLGIADSRVEEAHRLIDTAGGATFASGCNVQNVVWAGLSTTPPDPYYVRWTYGGLLTMRNLYVDTLNTNVNIYVNSSKPVSVILDGYYTPTDGTYEYNIIAGGGGQVSCQTRNFYRINADQSIHSRRPDRSWSLGGLESEEVVGSDFDTGDAWQTVAAPNPGAGSRGLRFKHGGAWKWYLYQVGDGSELYLRDTTNGVMAATFTQGAGAAGIAEFAGSVKPAHVATGSRPTAASAGAGAMIYDTTLSKPIWSNGTVWKDAAGTTV